MAFEFKHGESIRKGTRRVARRQLENALGSLRNSVGEGTSHDEFDAHKETDLHKETIDAQIHSARKSLKRVRAVLRLVRPAIGKSTYQRENQALRDAARPLSAVRDAKVLIDALDKLEENHREAAENGALEQARSQLVEHQGDVRRRVLEDGNAISATATAVEEALSRLEQWTDQPIHWRDLARGIKRVYRSGQAALEAAKYTASDEILHELRKQVKYLRHQLELLAPTRPNVVGTLAKQAEELGELLGNDHDLAVLRSMLTSGGQQDVNGHEERSQQDGHANSLAAVIDRQRTEMQNQAIPKGELLYQDRPKQFIRRLKTYWREWSKEPKRSRVADE